MPRHLLILDIDETLVYADRTPLDRPADFVVGPFHLYRRPFLEIFLEQAREWFDLAVWSSASGDYVNGVVENLFGAEHGLRFVWSHDRCTRRFHPEHQEYYFAKNLSKLRKLGFELDRMLIIDDSPEKVAKHFGNHIGVNPFRGDPSDHELRDLLPFLDSLRSVENVRRMEKRTWRSSRPSR